MNVTEKINFEPSLEEGRNKIRSKQYVDAIDIFERIITVCLSGAPNDHQTIIACLSNISLCLFQLERWVQVINITNIILDRNPGDDIAWKTLLRKCDSLHHLQDYQELSNILNSTKFQNLKATRSDPKIATWESAKGADTTKEVAPKNNFVQEYIHRNIIRKAVETLTRNRQQAHAISPDSVENVVTTIRDKRKYFPSSSSHPISKYFQEWKNRFQAQLISKQPQELRLLFIPSSPASVDSIISLYTSFGITSQNIWILYGRKDQLPENSPWNSFAIEESSIASILQKLQEQQSPIKFDIVHYQSEASMPSLTRDTVSDIVALVGNSAHVESPCAVITTMGAPSSNNTDNSNSNQSSSEKSKVTEFVINYVGLKSKEQKTLGSIKNSNVLNKVKFFNSLAPTDLFEFDIFNLKTFINNVNKDFESYYGTLITQMILDCASVFGPWKKLRDDPNMWNLFLESETRQAWKDSMAKVASSSNMPDVWLTIWAGWTRACETGKIDEIQQNWFKKFLELNPELDLKEALTNMAIRYWLFSRERFAQLLAEQAESPQWSDNMSAAVSSIKKSLNATLSQSGHKKILHDSVDVWHLSSVITMNKATYPLHAVPKVSERYQYNSDFGMQFTDLIFFDKCRIFYDWWPEMDGWATLDQDWFVMGYCMLEVLFKTVCKYDEQFSSFALLDPKEFPPSDFFFRKRFDL